MVVIQALVNKAVKFEESTAGEMNTLMDIANTVFYTTTNTTIPKICPLYRTAPRGWNSTKHRIDWSIKQRLKDDRNPQKVNAEFRDIFDRKYKEHTLAFMDGSVANGKIGIGLFLPPNQRISYQLSKGCSIFSAEAAAICLALQGTVDSPKTVIFSDSASVLSALEGGHSQHSWIQAIEEHHRPTVSYCWVPGLSNIPGNTIADLLANQGRSGDTWDLDMPGPDARNGIKHRIKEAWQLQSSSKTDCALKKIKPTIGKWTDRDSR